MLSLLGLAIIVAEIYFRVSYPTIFSSVVTMLWLVTSARVVGAIPRKVRTQQAQIVCSSIGWPMLLTFLALMAVSVYGMLIFGSWEYMLLIGFLWVLAHLTWKIFINPATVDSRSN